MIGTIIGAGLTAASSIFGGLKASKAAKKAKRETEQQRQRNQNWFDRAYNEDETQRADAQRLLEMTEDNIRNRNKAAAGTQAVMGGTDESTAATKAANNKGLADTASAINARADARKDDIERSYRQMDEGYSQDLRNIENQRAQNIANATKGAAQAAGQIASSLDGAFDKTNDGTATGSTAADQENKKPSKE